MLSAPVIAATVAANEDEPPAATQKPSIWAKPNWPLDAAILADQYDTHALWTAATGP